MTEYVCETVIAPQNAVSLELVVALWHLQHVSKQIQTAVEVNVTKYVIIKRTEVNQKKNIEDRNRQERVGK